MLDDFLNEDSAFPISPVNSVLDNLSLNGLSPSPTLSQPSFTWSSGNIPVFLYDNTYMDESLSTLFVSGDNKRESAVTLCDAHRSSRFSTSLRAHRDSVIISSSTSSDTIRSAATFGTRTQPASCTAETRHPGSSNRFSRSGGEQLHSESTISEELGCEEAASLEGFQGTGLLSVSNHSNTLLTARGQEKQHLNIGESYSVPSIERADTPSGQSTYMEPPSSATQTSTLVEDDNGLGDFKSSPTVRTWVSFTDWDHEDRTALESTSEGFTGTGLAPNADETESEDLPHASPVLERSDGLTAFLRISTVQFLVDQEGFRDAEPSFKFCGISRVRSSKSQEKSMAQFRPISRQQFHFHHALLETPPVLRRITVNNDNSSDYVSRQAHLTLKSNGVYVIYGHEVSSTEQTPDQTKLYWQFEYLVDDRRVESSGSRRDLEGEKTFTPLTFSCSPRLLLPSQAKRINIMHVFKKSLAPKLVAEKLQVRLGAYRNTGNPSPEKTLSPINYKRNRPRDLPLRDDGPNKPAVNGHILMRPHSESLIAVGKPHQEPQPLSRRFDTHISLPPSPADNNQGSNTSSSPDFPSGSPRVDRHIVAPARLSELLLLDSSAKENYAQSRLSPVSPCGGLSSADSETFVGLSPRPKRPASSMT